VESLNEADRQADGKQDDWSAKDEIAHAVTWIDRFVERLDEPAGEVPDESIDVINTQNATIFEAHRSETLVDVLAFANRVRSTLRVKVEEYSEEELNSTDRWPWLDGAPLWREVLGNAYTHPLIHYASFLTRHGQSALATHLQEAGFARLMALDESPVWCGANLYNLACHYALIGDKDKALALLTQALALQPQLAEWSKQDTDLALLHKDPAFRALVD
jgi:hypothetical protein